MNNEGVSQKESEEQALKADVNARLSKTSLHKGEKIKLENGNVAESFFDDNGDILYIECYPNGKLLTSFMIDSAKGQIRYFRQFGKNGELEYSANFYENGSLMSSKRSGEAARFYQEDGKAVSQKIARPFKNSAENGQKSFKSTFEKRKKMLMSEQRNTDSEIPLARRLYALREGRTL